MKLKLLTLISFLVLASCKQAAQTVVVVGDSWASYICYYKSLDKALNKVGITDAATNSTCAATTLPGVRAAEWLGNSFHKATLVALQDKSVKVLYLSLGGNDILNLWHKDMTVTQENEVFATVSKNIENVIKVYQQARPDIKIILSGYDYPRFTADHPIKSYREAYEDMGKPSPFELNSGIVRFSEYVSKLADQKSVFYIHHYGLMHYYLGNAEKGLAPMKTLSPDQISAPNAVNQLGGDLNLQTDPSGMFSVKVGNLSAADAFHLNHFGYDMLAEHTVFHYLKDWLKH
jgi:lysophospholipase L1-like esterase